MHAEDEIIAGRLPGATGQPAHHRFIITVFGLYGRSSGGVIPVALLVRLLQDLGCEPASVRSSISRLKKKGVLTSEKIDGQNGYTLSPELEEHFSTRDERIFVPSPAAANDPWLLASFSVPEAQRAQRNKIRAGLARMGFGNVAPGLCIAPNKLFTEASDFVSRNDLHDYVEFFISNPAGPGQLRDKVAQWWDLEALEHYYAEFIDAHSGELKEWRRRKDRTDLTYRDAFKAYIPMVTQWRRLPFLDPGLPLESLPDNWKGTEARQLFSDLHGVLGPLAARHANRVIHGQREAA
ncbi:PaaX family transcriptional regulator C-terminal domain-containing protein [Arthrobacter sp. StoSoilB5]|uniref:PaaX family transcriptional regulator n=1 Tax=Arthrobacter sp. StoSoilB5 TaxID=2830992 RepID=UPI001CC66FED|nr:PaaX family transcriptional regulator C-terminal domain-containing protein [Arthrobacter sp. StoSoilB5]BCW44931.1 PaaX family transcriptional regulator [Arthrobacter sp. StoSoilB5]